MDHPENTPGTRVTALVDQRGKFPPLEGTAMGTFQHHYFLPDGTPNSGTFPAIGMGHNGLSGPTWQKIWIERLLDGTYPLECDGKTRMDMLQYQAPIAKAAAAAYTHAMQGSGSKMPTDMRLPRGKVHLMKDVAPRLRRIGPLMAEKLAAIPHLPEGVADVVMQHWPAQLLRLEKEVRELPGWQADEDRTRDQEGILHRLAMQREPQPAEPSRG